MSVAFFMIITQFTVAGSIVKDGHLNPGLFWDYKQFENKVLFELVEKEGVKAIHLFADNAAGSAFTKTNIDINTTPYLKWTWRVDDLPDNKHEINKKNDDYPLRIYVIYKPSRLIFKIRTLGYVFASQGDQLDAYKSAYTKKIQLIAIEKGKKNIGQWLSYKVNIKQDFKTHFNLDVDDIYGVAIMSDSDNVSNIQQGWISNIEFVAN